MQNVPFAAIRLTCYFLDGIYVVPFHKLDDAEQRKPRGVRNPDKRHSVKPATVKTIPKIMSAQISFVAPNIIAGMPTTNKTLMTTAAVRTFACLFLTFP